MGTLGIVGVRDLEDDWETASTWVLAFFLSFFGGDLLAVSVVNVSV